MTDNGRDLSHNERLRLEALNQAVALNGVLLGPKSDDSIITTASRFERFIRGSSSE